MASVVVQSATFRPNEDTVQVVGTVDGVPYTVTVWRSHLQGLATAVQKRNYVAGQLKAAADREAAPTDMGISGTVTV